MEKDLVCTVTHKLFSTSNYVQISKQAEILTANSSVAVMYGLSPVVRARNAASTSRADWTFSVSRLIMNAMYSCSETKPSLHTHYQVQHNLSCESIKMHFQTYDVPAISQ